MMARYLDPKNDLIFKRIFGEHPDLLIDFLNALMPLTPDRMIKEIEYLPAEQVPDNPGKKNSIVDVKCKDKSGGVFIIEMQMLWTDDFTKRLIFNAGKAYVRQLKKGEDYHLLQPVYTLAILNESFDHQTKRFYHHYSIVNKENTKEVIEGLEFVLVELPKFKTKKWRDRQMAALWLRFLKEVNESMFRLPKDLAGNEQIRKAAELCEEAGFTPEELAAYEAYWDIISTEKTIRKGTLAQGRVEGEAIGLEKGEAIGLEKGEAIGLEKGEAIGLEKGKAIGETSILEKIVVEGKLNGFSLEQIQSLTKLTVAQIIEILKRHGVE